MLILLPFLWKSKVKRRVWFALMGASVAALVFPPLTVRAYLVIDALAGGVALYRKSGEPRYFAQKAIGMGFVMMLVFHIAYLLNGGPDSQSTYYDAMVWAGWFQLACLAGWWAYDVREAFADHFRAARDSLASEAGA